MISVYVFCKLLIIKIGLLNFSYWCIVYIKYIQFCKRYDFNEESISTNSIWFKKYDDYLQEIQ